MYMYNAFLKSDLRRLCFSFITFFKMGSKLEGLEMLIIYVISQTDSRHILYSFDCDTPHTLRLIKR